MPDTVLRIATPADVPAIHSIFDYYATNSSYTFQTSTPSFQELTTAMSTTLVAYPYIVATCGGEVVGYAKAERFRRQHAYDWSVEESIYVSDGLRGQGIGTRLLGCLCDLLTHQGILKVYACLAVPNEGSEALHRSLGFEDRAVFPQAGFKFGNWRDIHWLEKTLGPLGEPTSSPTPFFELDKMDIERILDSYSDVGQAPEGSL